MSIENFPQYSYWKLADSSETVFSGGYSFTNDQQLSQIIAHIYKHGTGGGTERIRPIIAHDRGLTNILATGDWFNLSDIASLPQYWRGRVPLVFTDKPWIEAAKTYYLGIEVGNYTRNALTFYLSFLIDNYDQINPDSAGYGLAVEFYGYRKKTEEI